MIDDLKQLSAGDMLTLDNDEIYNFTNGQDFYVIETNSYDVENGEIVIIQLDTDFTLVVHNFTSLVKLYIYELYEEHSDDVYYRENRFASQIKLEGGAESVVYTRIGEGQTTDTETVFCEYNSDSYFNSILIRVSEENTEVFRGFEIGEDDLVI